MSLVYKSVFSIAQNIKNLQSFCQTTCEQKKNMI